MAANIPLTAIAILNYNGAALLRKYLPPLLQYTPSEIEIYVIDNGSTDDSTDAINQFSPRVQIVSLAKNYGFAEGYNQGLKHIHANYLALINSDILIENNWLSPIISFLQKNNHVGACQPKILSINTPSHFEYAGAAGGFLDSFGYPFCRGRILHSVEADSGQYNTKTPVFWASGAAIVIRAEVFHRLGGFDGDYFAHMEEIDLCWRIQRLGFEIYCVPESHVFHLGGGTLTYGSPKKTYLNFRNNLNMLLKNLPSDRLFFALIIRMILDGLAGIQFLFKGEFHHFKAIVKAHFSFYSSFSHNYKKRKKLHVFYLGQSGKDYPIKGVLKGSILWNYYILKRKLFSEIKQNIK